MAASKKENLITIKPVQREQVIVTLVGDTPLITHAWSEKAKKMMLDAQQGKAKGQKKEFRNPVAEFLRSMYWLDGMPEIPEGSSEEECERIFAKAVSDGARFGFPAVAIKEAATSAAYRQGYTKNKTVPSSSFNVWGTDFREYITIESDTPRMREDMVHLSMGVSDLRYRAEFPNWKAKILISYIKDGVFSLESILNMINLGGFTCGIGEWRNEKEGLFGSYHVEGQKA